ncbi:MULTISPECIES: peptide-methionine (S)-S-oxide reductase MsrA [Pseudanabaena]|uniref:Peptide methionine sulfoxide reductase MsrA n=2 Tax=Pseudanabaena TaxID=1152 RepID=L8MYI1_9CYAN|nr:MULTISPECIES: peptide-methionine (S)-S-oxide reductase MsrA [Pseudanabaena]ELS32546.1 Peptide methionine sulfoxide reductase msrA [Pseudanabaena biceps PCC 7429]MDG3495205.1 peptide-methionine (S)-S-oxide reductase MsrA [Pseudanabaena catenata USMAC16]
MSKRSFYVCCFGFGSLAIATFFLNSISNVTAIGSEPRTSLVSTNVSSDRDQGKMTAVFAGGCFWGMEAVFEHLQGVSNVVSGYSGGTAQTANYETVGSGQTGHAESIKVTYDPSQISYEQLLQIYFYVAHDPTQLNRQGPDSGSQYRSAIFFANEKQKQIAQAYIDNLNKSKAFSKPIVTKLEPLQVFYAAEDYHQDFIAHNPNYPYVVINDLPKIAQLKKQFPEMYK